MTIFRLVINSTERIFLSCGCRKLWSSSRMVRHSVEFITQVGMHLDVTVLPSTIHVQKQHIVEVLDLNGHNINLN